MEGARERERERERGATKVGREEEWNEVRQEADDGEGWGGQSNQIYLKGLFHEAGFPQIASQTKQGGPERKPGRDREGTGWMNEARRRRCFFLTLVMTALEGSLRLGFFFLTSSSSS